MADRILHHLPLVVGKAFGSTPSSELPYCASNEEVEDDEEDEGKDNPIHRGLSVLEPQSYGRDTYLSRISEGWFSLKTRYSYSVSP